jgi:acyl-CoA thioesterase I
MPFQTSESNPQPHPQQASRHLPADRATSLRYTALGDSTVEGIGATGPELHYVGRLDVRLRSVYPRAQLHNLGLAGATAADLVALQLRPAVALRPHLVTISIGPNDLTQGRPVEAYESDLHNILDTLARQTTAVIVVNLLPDLALAPAFTPEERAQVGPLTTAFNEALTRQARRHDAELVDLYSASREEVPDHLELVAADGYHPSDAGYARWADYLWPAIERRIDAPGERTIGE